jgi:hypothetical protein
MKRFPRRGACHIPGMFFILTLWFARWFFFRKAKKTLLEKTGPSDNIDYEV